jgi:hypothetical protein
MAIFYPTAEVVRAGKNKHFGSRRCTLSLFQTAPLIETSTGHQDLSEKVYMSGHWFTAHPTESCADYWGQNRPKSGPGHAGVKKRRRDEETKRQRDKETKRQRGKETKRRREKIRR